MASRIMRANGLDVRIVQAAVGASPGLARLHLSAISDSSNSLVKGFKPSLDELAVDVITIDDYCDTNRIAPTLLKLDVEAFEPEVLSGARRTIERYRPTIVVEVLTSRGPEHGDAINDAMKGLAYEFHPLADDPTWEAEPRIAASVSRGARDWLLLPEPLDDEFARRSTEWSERIAVCTPDRNSRPPVVRSVRLAYTRGGAREVFATGCRQATRLAAKLRRSFARSRSHGSS
jgi:FkbM family methyltransferase